MATEVTVETLERFLDAFNAHDIDAVMSFFADDCVLEMPRGPDPWGRRLVGRERVREGLASRFAGIPDVHYGDARHWVAGDRGGSEWLLTGTNVEGEAIEVRGCDLFEFRGGTDHAQGLVLEDRRALGTPRGASPTGSSPTVRCMTSAISFAVQAHHDGGGLAEVVPVVDGVPLTDLIDAFERAAGIAPPPSGHGGLIPALLSLWPGDRAFHGGAATGRSRCSAATAARRAAGRCSPACACTAIS